MRKILSFCLALMLMLLPCVMNAEQNSVKISTGRSVDNENMEALIEGIADGDLDETTSQIIKTVCDVVSAISSETLIDETGCRSSIRMQGNEVVHFTMLNNDGKLTLTSDLIPNLALQLDLNDPKIQELINGIMGAISGVDLSDFISRLTAEFSRVGEGIEVTRNEGETVIDFLGQFKNNTAFKLDGNNLAGYYEILINEIEKTAGVSELIRFLGGESSTVFSKLREFASKIRNSGVVLNVENWSDNPVCRIRVEKNGQELFTWAAAIIGNQCKMILNFKDGMQTYHMTYIILPSENGNSLAITMELLQDPEGKGYQAASETAGSRLITEDILITIEESGLTSDVVVVPMESAKNVIHTKTVLSFDNQGLKMTQDMFFGPEQKKITNSFVTMQTSNEKISAADPVNETVNVLNLGSEAELKKVTEAFQQGYLTVFINLLAGLPEDALALVMQFFQ